MTSLPAEVHSRGRCHICGMPNGRWALYRLVSHHRVSQQKGCVSIHAGHYTGWPKKASHFWISVQSRLHFTSSWTSFRGLYAFYELNSCEFTVFLISFVKRMQNDVQDDIRHIRVDGNFLPSPPTSFFRSPRISVTHFASPGVPWLDAPVTVQRGCGLNHFPNLPYGYANGWIYLFKCP